MKEVHRFSLRNVTLLDCWEIVKNSLWAIIVFVICCSLAFFFDWGSTDETATPQNSFLGETPYWVKISIICSIALFLFRSFASQFLEECGQMFIDLSSWLKNASFTSRLFYTTFFCCTFIILEFNVLIWWGLMIVIMSLNRGYEALKRERILNFDL